MITCGETLSRSYNEAKIDYARALELLTNESERRFIERRQRELDRETGSETS